MTTCFLTIGKRKSTFKKELDAVLDGKSNQTKIAKFTKTIHKDNNSTEKSPRFSADSAAERSKKKPQNVLLEYTKIQDGRVLDIAVIKEPFRDRYAIFGIDVDDGQRYELRLSSEEVSTTLDGDILVTSVDNVEVWMVLLNKVYLNKVAAFTKMPYTSEEVDLARPSTSRSSHKNDRPSSFQRPSTEEINSYVSRNGLYEKWTSNELLSQRSVDTEGDTPVVPSRPTTERPSTSRASHSRGASYIEDGQKNIVGDSLSIDTQSVYDENKVVLIDVKNTICMLLLI